MLSPISNVYETGFFNSSSEPYTILKADATEAQVAKICDEALAHDFASVCVNQYYTKFVAEKLKGSDVKVCTVVGFPLGMSDTRVKAFETRTAIEDGAQEVDMVINVGALKDGKYDFVRSDIQTLKEVAAHMKTEEHMENHRKEDRQTIIRQEDRELRRSVRVCGGEEKDNA